ncbi:hypothetical protein [Salipiger mucosus]|uniref:hypothetical protein n=1 Tax=Salipiger mucosus TaxID=263378 RepID=UPI0012EB91C5|nr:hypothetical protein [Salipiger mucosus]
MRQDWFEHRDELEPDMVFRHRDGSLVMLDRPVPGDGTQWYVAEFWNGSWAWMDTIVEPGDLLEPAEDPKEPTPASPMAPR